MTTVLSVMTPPIVWPKKRASVTSGTIIKEQEWAVHIKQHSNLHGYEEENRPRGAGPGGEGEERKEDCKYSMLVCYKMTPADQIA